MNEFLTKEEIIELTGKKRPGDQIAWLTKNGWCCVINAAGRPVVSRNHARFKLGGAVLDNPVGSLPNFGALA